tara:strand:- start:642 stop:1058 length:417 start_codon:yes stop_codon:yes gene_type:complete
MTNATINTKTDLQQHVESIANDLQQGIEHEFCPDCGSQDFDQSCCDAYQLPQADGTYLRQIMSGFDYLSDALDIQYIVTGSREYVAARILVAFGGPNIWINTQTKQVEGYWWGETAFQNYFADEMDIDGTCRELWECK